MAKSKGALIPSNILLILITAISGTVIVLSISLANAQAPTTTPSPAIQPTSPPSSVTISTSAVNNQAFFGQGAVQVVVTDPNARSGGGVTQSTIPVSIVAESLQGKTVAADTFDIPETVLGVYPAVIVYCSNFPN